MGAVVAGIPMDAFGRKKTFIACVLGTAGCIFIQFFARSLPALFVGELLGGLTLGFYVVIAPTYASEVAPLRLRGILTSYTNLCFVVGQLIANGITAATQSLESHWAYSIPFALQWLWVLLILPVVPFAPESPWWLLRRARLDDAERSLRRLSSSSVDSKAHLDAIAKIDRMERETEAGSTYVDCFNRLNMRRTEICIGVYSIQVLSGIYLVNYGTYFFQLAVSMRSLQTFLRSTKANQPIQGLSTKESFDMGIAFLAVGFVGTCTSWALIDRVGRRALYTIGLGILAGLQLIIGVLDCVPDYDSRKSVVWTQSSLMMVWNFFYDLSVGPICFIIICECSATRVRSKTIAVSTAVQAMLGIIMTVAIPYLINPDEANFRGKLGFFFGGLAALSWFWSFWRVPETAGRTFEELDLLFERRVPARVFKDYQIWT